MLDATGVAVNAIPMTPKRLFEAFGKAGLIRHSRKIREKARPSQK
ncbi:MAG: hypothetical protein V8Q84_09110 [Bilophila sp.]